MNLKLLIVLLLNLFFLISTAQKPVQLGKNSSDCLGALMINDSIIGPVYSYKGFGNKLEISGYELGDPFFIEKEHNTVWYKFTAPYDAIFEFDLIPIRKDDDFDFLLFQHSGPNFCEEVMNGTAIPVRTNISRKNVDVSGKTGLSQEEAFDYVPSGPGSSYSRALTVRKGEMFYLLVDNPFRENEGHSIHLKFTPFKIDPNVAAEEPKFDIPYRQATIRIFDAETGNQIPANISIDGIKLSESVDFVQVSQIMQKVISYKSYIINVVKSGYLLKSETFIPKNDSAYTVDIKLKPIEVGDRINLQNIKFESDKTEILDKSLPALNQVRKFLVENPNVRIEIQGHVNGESKRNKRSYRKLSSERAEAIYNKLLESGIGSGRMEYKGYGNSKMIYPNPINNRQQEANRRVELEVKEL